MRTMMLAFIRDESGATAIEYGIIASMVCIAIIASLSSVSTALQGLFNKVAAAFP
nr:Flp family type IVb pilin [Hyphomicrobium sp.]